MRISKMVLGIICMVLLFGVVAVSAQVVLEEEVYREIDAVIERFNQGEITEKEVVELVNVIAKKPAGYPRGHIEYIIGWGVGGGSDRFARMIGREAEKFLGVPMVYRNMPGAASELAVSYVMGSSPDGQVIYGTTVVNTLNEAHGDLPYSSLTDITHIGSFQGPSEAFWVLADSPYKTIEELIEFAKENPGELIAIGATVGGDSYLPTRQLMLQADIDVRYLGYDTGGDRIAAFLGGHGDFLHESVGPLLDLFQAGRVRPILYQGHQRFEDIDPDVPAATELGFDLSIQRHRGVAGPPGMSDELVKYLHYIFYAASQMPDYKEYEKNAQLHYSEPWVLGPQEKVEWLQHQFEEAKKLFELLEETE